MFPFHERTPYIKDVTLNVTSLERSITFYRDLLGLEILGREQGIVHLGTNHNRLLLLREVDGTHRNQEGLFHVAYLLPSMSTLASWVEYHIKRRTPLSGASDHEVSHAIYLEDPDGNGVEVYADTPQESWIIQNDTIHMGTRRLDIKKLLSHKEQEWGTFTPILKIGHVHLRAKKHREAQRFYHIIGLDQTFDYGSASFLSYAGYHHHIAINQWGTFASLPHDDEVADLYHMSVYTPDINTVEQRLSESNIPYQQDNGDLIMKDEIGIHITITTKENTI